MRVILVVVILIELSVSALAQPPSSNSAAKANLSRVERREKKEREKLRRRRRDDPDRYSEIDRRGGFKKFQLELVKPFTTYQVTVSPSGGTQSLTNDSNSEIGVRFTYAKIRDERFGYSASGAYLEYGGGSTSGSLRFEAAGTYGFSNLIYTLYGLHLQKFVNAETAEVIDLGFGAQIVFGIQATRNFGFKVAYYYTMFTEKELNVLGTVYTVKTNFQAPELAIYWSF